MSKPKKSAPAVKPAKSALSTKPAVAAKPSKSKQVKAAAPVASVAAKVAPKPEEISARAHKIWVDAGKPEGKSLEHWLQAERELSGK